MFYFVIKTIKIIVKPIKYGISSLIGALHNGSHKWKVKNYVLSYLSGIFLAIVFWKTFIQTLGFPIDFTYGLLLFLVIILGLGFVFTTAIKCITVLACVGLLGKTGRSFLRALCMTYIISGPLSNLAFNGQETVRVFACTTVLTYNLTKTRFDLMSKPFQNTLAAMKDEMADIRKNFENIEEVLQPIKDEIDDENQNNSSNVNPIVERFIRQDILPALSFADPTNQTERLSKAQAIKDKYSKKMQLRCREQLEKGENRCKNAFSSAHEKCMERLPVVVDTLLCWPLRIDFVCNMELLGYQETGGICDPSGVIDPKLGENMINLKETEHDLFQNVTDAGISFEVVKIQQPPQLKAAKETANIVMEEITAKKKSFDYIMSIMQRILSFVFLRVIHSSIMYHRNYLRRIDFDNIYIMPYFKRIDQRRGERNQHTLLPLKKFQRNFLVDTEKPCNHSKDESRAMTFLFLQFILEIFVSGLFLLLDHMIVVLLKIVASKSEITYYQEGEHIISFSINGTGLMARLMRTTLKNFNMHERVSTFLTNKPCLPQPSALPKRFYLTLLGLYLATLLLIYYSTLTMRSRMYICGFFYRKREKQRTLHLYNKMLKNRKILFETMYRKVKDDLEAKKLKMNLNLLLRLRFKYPKYFSWLRWFNITRRNCLICGEREPRNVQFVECTTSDCNFTYCEECWLDIGEVCVACQSGEKVLRCCN
ncbi:protein sneaky isoform X2 [Episyrphus balteatus]|uniref:protein sneaky isoform X2 n=1 Tax=Episyrphus balteatus TaxID=286459 RepID=UPI002485A651|nr:protein sneaky isoform X2 [Episyrphus balteatus]